MSDDDKRFKYSTHNTLRTRISIRELTLINIIYARVIAKYSIEGILLKMNSTLKFIDAETRESEKKAEKFP